MAAGRRWDIFCTVVDNFGDIGITWRLARQLVAEHDLQVRLWVDDLDSFRRIRPEVDPGLSDQTCCGVLVRRWDAAASLAEPADVVIEALACRLPETYEQAMAAAPRKPLWLNLEYLSAEAWVAGCHGLPSPHPSLPLTKYFFMPGYVAGTGGVLKESWLSKRRDAFQADAAVQGHFWHMLRVPEVHDDEIRVSLFSYENAAINDLFAHWAAASAPVRCLVPEGRSLDDVALFFRRDGVHRGDVLARGALTVQVLPMLDQDGYDQLLWACDCNFVRGEDSLVRAMWAGRPLVWQAYRQQEGAHWPKIEALLNLYRANLDERHVQILQRCWRAWNAGGPLGDIWSEFWAARERWLALSADWQTQLDRVGDLASNLVNFCNEKSN